MTSRRADMRPKRAEVPTRPMPGREASPLRSYLRYALVGLAFALGFWILIEVRSGEARKEDLPLLLGMSLCGALVGLQLRMMRNWAKRGPVRDYARWVIAFVVAATIVAIPFRLLGQITTRDAWVIVDFSVAGGLGFCANFRGVSPLRRRKNLKASATTPHRSGPARRRGTR